jgi:hypothetical protein
MRGSVFLVSAGAGDQKLMPQPDSRIAREHCEAMRDLIVLHAGGWRDVESLKKLQHMAAAAANALDDLESKHLASVISELGVALFSADDHEKWAQGKTSGADVLRLRILREINALQGRIAYIESVRSGAVQASGSPRTYSGKPR